MHPNGPSICYPLPLLLLLFLSKNKIFGQFCNVFSLWSQRSSHISHSEAKSQKNTFLNNLEHFWSILNIFVSSRTSFLYHLEHFWIILNIFVSFKTFLNHLEPFWIILNLFESFWTFLYHFEPLHIENILDHFKVG